mmetsp:Transcript_14134/g.50788  ORF Transcript_14134/g.50788 Transcript_14134/m.50788 type:complete len:108 (-) Transcript_14134:29-352(-)
MNAEPRAASRRGVVFRGNTRSVEDDDARVDGRTDDITTRQHRDVDVDDDARYATHHQSRGGAPSSLGLDLADPWVLLRCHRSLILVFILAPTNFFTHGPTRGPLHLI